MEKTKSVESALSKNTIDEKQADEIAVVGMVDALNSRRCNRELGMSFTSDIVKAVDISAEQISLILHSEVHLNLFKKIIRYDDSEWYADRPLDELRILLMKVANCNDYFEPKLKNMSSSGVIELKMADIESSDMLDRVDVVEKYCLFKEEIGGVAIAAGNRFSNPSVIYDILGYIRRDIELMIGRSCRCVNDYNQFSDIEFLNRRESARALEGALRIIDENCINDVLSVELYADIFSVLSEHKKFRSNLRKLAFALTFQKRVPLQGMFTELPEHPNINAIEQIDYFINKEVKGNVFKDVFKQERVNRRFERIFRTGPIEKRKYEISVRPISTREIQFIPTNGPLREFAAYIGDSCYAPQEKLFAENHPNVTAIIMKQVNSANGKERFVGSSLLIDSIDADGDKIAIIRALNPIENFINKLSIGDFFDQFTSYVKSAIGEEFTKVGIVIDGRAGGASTNRPLLFNYLKKLCDDGLLLPVSVRRDGTTINNFDISDKVYLL